MARTRPTHVRRVGTVRPSHLMFTAGVGSIVDLPHFSVLVDGTDDWRYPPDSPPPIHEPRLLLAANRLLGGNRPNGDRIKELRAAPWLDGNGMGLDVAAQTTGVPVTPFPQWLRCTRCNVLAPLSSGQFAFVNRRPQRPDEAKFVHDCRRSNQPLAVGARFVLACTNGHLDDFPYVNFVHGGGPCPQTDHPPLEMLDYGGNLGAQVTIHCLRCDAKRPINQALGSQGQDNLPRCRGRHPHFGNNTAQFTGRCDADPKLLIVGASNQWFPQGLSALAVPEPGTDRLTALVGKYWQRLQKAITVGHLDMIWDELHELLEWSQEEVFAAIESYRARQSAPDATESRYPDMHTAEWLAFTDPAPPPDEDDFTIRRDPTGVPKELDGIFTEIVAAERLREVRALVGFTRLDAPDLEDPTLVQRVDLSRNDATWLPASEVRGEGIFLRLPEDLLAAWEREVATHPIVEEHRGAYRRFRLNRYSDRVQPPNFDPADYWPGPRYIALHTLSHLLIRAIALDCGYNSASLSERIYSGDAESGDPRAGILVYTAVPDAEGTLGGLVSLAERDRFPDLVRKALDSARRCSSDPLCAERVPVEPSDQLYGAACHACLFVSETTCERGNRFLDRRFVVPLRPAPELAIWPDRP